jgi:RimJ/RimL family protein N-acetyltransferase
MDPMRVVSAPPLVLEPQLAAHAREMFAVLSDPAIYEFENRPPASEESLAERYAKLESRRSPDGTQAWLNWVIRLPSGALAGYVQATVSADGIAFIAYEIASRHWRQGIGSAAVAALIAELKASHGATRCVAVLKSRNFRSLGLLRKLGFRQSAGQHERHGCEADEVVMIEPGDHAM